MISVDIIGVILLIKVAPVTIGKQQRFKLFATFEFIVQEFIDFILIVISAKLIQDATSATAFLPVVYPHTILDADSHRYRVYMIVISVVMLVENHGLGFITKTNHCLIDIFLKLRLFFFSRLAGV